MMKSRKHKFFGLENVVIISILLVVSSLSISFAALVQNLSISGEVTVAAEVKAIRVTGVTYISAEGSAAQTSTPTFTDTSATTVVSYPNTTSTITYDVTIKNSLDISKKISEIMIDYVDDTTNILSKINCELLTVEGNQTYRELEYPIAAGEEVKVRLKLKYTETYKGITPFSAQTNQQIKINFTFDNIGENLDYLRGFIHPLSGDYVSGHYATAGMATVNGITMESLGNGLYILNGRDTNSNHGFFRLTDSVAAGTSYTQIKPDPLTVIFTKYEKYDLNVERISGTITANSGLLDNDIRMTLRKNDANFTMWNNFYYDFQSGPTTTETPSAVSAIIIFIRGQSSDTSSKNRNVEFNNAVFRPRLSRINVTGNIDDISANYIIPNQTMTMEGITVTIGDNRDITISGQYTNTSNKNLFIRLTNGLAMTHVPAELYDPAKEPVFTFNSTDPPRDIGICAEHITGTHTTIPTGSVNIVLRNYNSSAALTAPKLMLDSYDGLPQIVGLTETVSLVGIYIKQATRTEFNDFKFSLEFGDVYYTDDEGDAMTIS